MTKDVTMKDADEKVDDKKGKKGEKTEKEPEKPKDPNEVLYNELSIVLNRFQRGGEADFHEIGRGARQLNRFRGRLNNTVLTRLAATYMPEKFRERALGYARVIYTDPVTLPAAPPPAKQPPASGGGDAMETDEPSAAAAEQAKTDLACPESFAYLQLLVSVDLLDAKKYTECIRSLHQLIDYTRELNRRTLDLFSAKSYYYYSLAFYKIDKLVYIRNYLLAWYRTAFLQHNTPAQATLINLLLQNYLAHNLYTQADKFSKRTTFPETASPSEMARHNYYLGRIKLVQLQYSDALDSIQQAIQKAPNTGALGFVQQANKSLILTKLLMGDIPDFSVFAGDRPGVKGALIPYKQLTQAVRNGDLSLFTKTMTTFAERFKMDRNYSLIVRLRHNVIKTGLRKINLAYSRISMQDVCDRLCGASGESDSLLRSAEDTEYIVAKAIRDGVIDAVIEKSPDGRSILRSRENPDVYGTHEPYHELTRRVQFCLNVHDQAVKALRFPEDDEDEKPEPKATDKEDEEEAKEIEEAAMDEDEED